MVARIAHHDRSSAIQINAALRGHRINTYDVYGESSWSPGDWRLPQKIPLEGSCSRDPGDRADDLKLLETFCFGVKTRRSPLTGSESAH
jgi:hypothetical protein